MSDPTNSESVLLMIGELKGQMRELVHGLGDMRQIINRINGKVDSVSVTQAQLESLKQQVVATDLETTGKFAAVEVRLIAIERAENQRTGALKLSEVLIRIIPWATAGSLFAVVLAVAEKVLHGR